MNYLVWLSALLSRANNPARANVFVWIWPEFRVNDWTRCVVNAVRVAGRTSGQNNDEKQDKFAHNTSNGLSIGSLFASWRNRPAKVARAC